MSPLVPAAVLENLRQYHSSVELARWVDQLPAQITTLGDRWRFQVTGPPLPGGLRSLLLPVSDGRVLKLTPPGDELTHQALALRAWDGVGAARLLAADVAHGVLLIERLAPGHDAGELPWPEFWDAATVTLPRLWRSPVPGLRCLEQASRVWIQDASRADVALRARLLADSPAPVLVHGDTHSGNLLAGGSEWKWVDPSPVNGDPALDLEPLLRVAYRHTGDEVLQAPLRALCTQLEIGPWRVLGWSVLRWRHFGRWRNRSCPGSGDELLRMAARAAEYVQA